MGQRSAKVTPTGPDRWVPLPSPKTGLQVTDNLRKRTFIMANWCCLCKSDGRLASHLLLHCPIACDLWAFLSILPSLDHLGHAKLYYGYVGALERSLGIP
uniref:Reverse transcriptase zinc-binding domain-containing protein n=1 Tax=Quercus lobata TaxID=97700 RepID=A0A7N2LIU1_QUELO